MAKATGPLMSIDARGSIGKSIVFSGWKGVKVVRQWLKPANPNTVGQQAQRVIFSDSVALYQLLTGNDKAAWVARASGQALSGFNLFMKKVIDVVFAGNTWANYTGVDESSLAATSVQIDGTSDHAGLVKVKYGTSPGVYPSETEEPAGRVAAGAFAVDLTGLTTATKYYYTLVQKTQGAVTGESGEYNFTTS